MTAYELVHDKLPATLVLDSMVAALLRTRNIAAVVVGADRVRFKTKKLKSSCFKITNYYLGCRQRRHSQ